MPEQVTDVDHGRLERASKVVELERGQPDAVFRPQLHPDWRIGHPELGHDRHDLLDRRVGQAVVAAHVVEPAVAAGVGSWERVQQQHGLAARGDDGEHRPAMGRPGREVVVPREVVVVGLTGQDGAGQRSLSQAGLELSQAQLVLMCGERRLQHSPPPFAASRADKASTAAA